jgi:RNA polymerase sigma-70 factor (ECF subfamily)
VAINTSINRIKKEGRTIYTNQLPDSLIQNDDYSNLMQEEETRILIEAIQKLNEIDKSIMLLYLDGLSYNEIAGIIGISASNVGVRISRAKDMLKKILKD